jgi:flavodoxin
MKTLVAFYSRTGTTKKIGEVLAQKIGADVEEIRDTVERNGVKGYLISGRDAMKKKLTTLQPTACKVSDYDLVIIGTPIWSWNMSVPIRTYITENKGAFKKVAFFCTMGGSGDEKAFLEMENILGQKPLVTLALKTREVVKNNYSDKLENFLSQIK